MTSASTSNAPAIRAFGGKSAGIGLYVTLVLAGAALIAVSAKIQVPFWPVPMTLQTFAIMGIAALYGARLGVATILTYLGAGLAGAPVFAGPAAGPLYFAGPTAGFLIGFIVIAAVVGYAADRGWAKSPFKLFGAMLGGNALCFVLGFIWLAFMFVSAKSGSTLGAETAFNVGIKPFILAGLLKVALATAMVSLIDRSIKR